MDPFIVVRSKDKVIDVIVRNDGTTNEHTLRAAFLLKNDVPIGLFRNEIALERRPEGNGCIFELGSGWYGAEFTLCWEESRRSRQIVPVQQGPSKPKKQRIEVEYEELPVDGDLAASIARYALYYTKNDKFKRCAIPLTTKIAAIHRHGENKSIKLGDEIVIRSWSDEKLEVSTRVVKFIEEFDTIILQSDGADLCDEDLTSRSIEPRKGMHYLMMGFSIVHGKTNHQSLSAGIITSDVTRWLRYTGSNSYFGYDSGGSCWNENGQLMGMQVENVLHMKNEEPASGSRYCFVPISAIRAHIQLL